MVPPVQDQITAVLVVPVTWAVNCFCWPRTKAVGFGLTTTVTGVGPAASRDPRTRTHKGRATRRRKVVSKGNLIGIGRT
jgi:hypothetical protein